MSVGKSIRLTVLGVIIGLGAYWAGARWGAREPVTVSAVPEAQRPVSTEGLTPDEALNVKIYQQAAPAVANIVTRAVEYDFFFNPV
ncbi:MAG: hypothetical protein QW050_02145, partial [Candidatus Nitrosocaldaceae archaeon]